MSPSSRRNSSAIFATSSDPSRGSGSAGHIGGRPAPRRHRGPRSRPSEGTDRFENRTPRQERLGRPRQAVGGLLTARTVTLIFELEIHVAVLNLFKLKVDEILHAMQQGNARQRHAAPIIAATIVDAGANPFAKHIPQAHLATQTKLGPGASPRFGAGFPPAWAGGTHRLGGLEFDRGRRALRRAGQRQAKLMPIPPA